MTLGGAARRQKGHAWEREVAELFRKAGYPDAHRGWQSRAGCDDPDIVGVSGYWIECRCRDYVNVPASLRKALADRQKAAASKYGWVAVVGKRTHRAGESDPLPTKFVAMTGDEARGWTDTVAKAMEGSSMAPVSFLSRSHRRGTTAMEYAVFPLDAWFAGVATIRGDGGPDGRG